MSATNAIPESRRLPIRLSRPLWIGVATAALAVVGAGLHYGLGSNRRHPAIREIERLGGTVEQKARGKSRRLWEPIADEQTDLGSAKLFVSFTEPRKMTNAGLANLEGLTNVEWLWLGHAPISDAGMVHLKGLSNLQYLELNRTQVTDAGLEYLKGLNLTRLDLTGILVTNQGLTHLEKMTNLQVLDLSETKVTDAGITHLKGLSNLKWLDLAGTSVGDEGVGQLSGLTSLENLRLDSTHVTDAGLGRLDGRTHLRFLDVSGTAVTDAGVAELKRVMPNLKVQWSGATALRGMYPQ